MALLQKSYSKEYKSRPVPQFKIVYDEPHDDYIIQRYINSVLGWTFCTIRKTRKEAEEWVLGSIK